MNARKDAADVNKPAEAGRDTAQRAAGAGRRTAEETTEATRAAVNQAAETSRNAADAMADIARSTAETAQQAVQSGLQMATMMTERSLDRFASVMGLPSCGEEAEGAAQQATRNMQAVAQRGRVLAHAYQDVARELLEHGRERLQKNLGGFNALMRARTPQDIIAVQSVFVRDNLEDMLQESRHVSEIMLTSVDQAMGRMACQAREGASEARA